jgi:hypothetical protein
MKLEELNRIKKEIEADLEITDDNVLGKTLEVPKIYQKYLSVFLRESIELKKLKADLDKCYGLKIRGLKENIGYKLNAGETEGYVDSEEDYFLKRKEFFLQEAITKYLEDSIVNIKNLSFNISNYIALKKFLLGG